MQPVKEAIAASLLEVFKTVLSRPDDQAVKTLCGLLTQAEIEELLQRNVVRRTIVDTLTHDGSFSIPELAKECDCSPELVRRVWRAIRDEYPPENNAASELRVAIPKEERAHELVEETLLSGGFRIEIQNKRKRTGFIVDIRNGLDPVACQIIPGVDILTHMKAGASQLAFLGTDIIEETSAKEKLAGIRPAELVQYASYHVNRFRMSLAIPKGEIEDAKRNGIDWFNGKVLLTSYPATLEQFLAAKNIFPREIIPLKGGVEQSMAALGADAIMDVVETGNSLRESGLVAYDRPLYEGSINLVAFAETRMPERSRQQVERLTERLRGEPKLNVA